MNKSPLRKSIEILLFLILSITVLYVAREFLIPIALAGMFAMLLVPLSRRLERKGMNRGFATLCCILLLLLVVSAIVALISWQVSNFISESAEIEQHLKKVFQQLQQFFSNLGITKQQQEQILKKEASGPDAVAKLMAYLLGSACTILLNMILVLVYVFLLMYLRDRLRQFVLKLVPENKQSQTETIINEASKVAQQYLNALATMVVMLWIMYGIGFSIIGVKYAIFFAIICGILEIIPFVGNITGSSLAVLMVLAQGGGLTMVIGVIGTYLLIQIIQTYILEPLVVGSGVNINPLFTILAIVAGELIWGVGGMAMALPILGIVKIICDHVEPLKPYGFLIGQDKKKKEPPSFIAKIMNWVR